MHNGFLIAALAVAATVILGLTYYFRASEEVSPPVAVESEQSTDDPLDRELTVVPLELPDADPVIEETPPSPALLEPPALVLPTLDESDGFVRERLENALLPESWIGKDDLLRRLAVVIENANRGLLPRRQLDYLAPEGKFQILETKGETEQDRRLFIDPQSFARYDRYLDVLESVSPETLAMLFVDASPLLDEALLELGTRDPAGPQLLAAIDQILALPILSGDVELVQPKVFYEYRDPALEALTPLQKQVLRTGPANVARLQAYAARLRDGLLINSQR